MTLITNPPDIVTTRLIGGATGPTSSNTEHTSIRPLKIDKHGRLVIAPAGFSHDDSTIDAFGRIRVSNPWSMWDSIQEYDSGSLFWGESGSAGYEFVWDSVSSFTKLQVDDAIGSLAVRQSKAYMRYNPGKSQYILTTGWMNAAKTGLVQRLGYFDNSNGIFFECSGSNLYIVQRHTENGSIIDTKISQSNWDIDKFDGTGISEHNIDFTKDNIFFIDLEWLGSGRVRTGFVIDGEVRMAHHFHHANSSSLPYMSTPNLPVKYEIWNESETDSPSTMSHVCTSVQSEGGFEPLGIIHTSNTDITLIDVRQEIVPIISIRPKQFFGGKPNRSWTIPINFDIIANTSNVFFELVYNGTLNATSSAWTSSANLSAVEYHVSGTFTSSDHVLASGYIAAGGTGRGNQAASDEAFTGRIFLTVDLSGSISDTLTLYAKAFTGTATVAGSITWRELW